MGFRSTMKIDVPPRAEYARVITSELNRISSHLVWWGALLLDLGGFTPILYAFDDREFAADMRCVAMPVFERGGDVPGGIAISGPGSSAATIAAVDCDTVVIATPVDLARLVAIDKPSCRVRYDLEEIRTLTSPGLFDWSLAIALPLAFLITAGTLLLLLPITYQARRASTQAPISG